MNHNGTSLGALALHRAFPAICGIVRCRKSRRLLCCCGHYCSRSITLIQNEKARNPSQVRAFYLGLRGCSSYSSGEYCLGRFVSPTVTTDSRLPPPMNNRMAALLDNKAYTALAHRLWETLTRWAFAFTGMEQSRQENDIRDTTNSCMGASPQRMHQTPL